jgi:hypothetical protein
MLGLGLSIAEVSSFGSAVAGNSWPYGDYDDINGLGDEANVQFMVMFDQHIGQEGNSVPDETGDHTITIGANATITSDGLVMGSPDAEGATVPDSPDWRIVTGDHFGVLEVLFTREAALSTDAELVQIYSGTGNNRSVWLRMNTSHEIRALLSENGTLTDKDFTSSPTTVPLNTLYYAALMHDGGKTPTSNNRFRIYLGEAGVTNGVTEAVNVINTFAPYDAAISMRIGINSDVRIKGVRFRRIETGFPTSVPGVSDPFTAPLGFGKG